MTFKGVVYLHARLVWVYLNGNIPEELQIDHIDGERANDKQTNQRLANHSQQGQNKGPNSRSKTGVKGVCFIARRNKYRADIRANGKRITLGYFVELEDAVVARKEAELKYHGEFARS